MLDLNKAVPQECILAFWLYDHPGKVVIVSDTFFRFDPEKKCFMYHKPTNRVRTGWYRAWGLDEWFNRGLLLLQEGEDHA